jgi:hypothetical protein
MKHNILILPVGILNPVGLLIASRNTLESDAYPSQPRKTNINFMLGVQTPNTLVATSPFRVQYLGLSCSGTRTLM